MRANYEMMDSISDELNSITDDMLENMKQAKNLIGKLKNGDFWPGSGYDSYNDKFNKMYRSFGTYMSELYKLNAVIKRSASNYRKVDKEVTRK